MLKIAKLGTFGDFSRYALERWTSERPVLTALGANVSYAVRDAEQTDPITGGPAVIRQEDSLSVALGGLASGAEIGRLVAADARRR